ncbi:MAG: hypothetical protein R3C97_11425 [Geminicoccaceae bacterium]
MSHVARSPYQAEQDALLTRVSRWGPLRLLRWGRLYITRRFREMVDECRPKRYMAVRLAETFPVLGVAMGLGDAPDRPRLEVLLKRLAAPWIVRLGERLAGFHGDGDRGERAWLAWAFARPDHAPIRGLLHTVIRRMDDRREVAATPPSVAGSPETGLSEKPPASVRGQSTSEEERDEEHEARCERRRGRRILLRELADWLVLALHERALTEDIPASARAQMAAGGPVEPPAGPPPNLYTARVEDTRGHRGGIFEKSGW